MPKIVKTIILSLTGILFVGGLAFAGYYYKNKIFNPINKETQLQTTNTPNSNDEPGEKIISTNQTIEEEPKKLNITNNPEKDSDNDGLIDQDEINIWKTNPNNSDTDNDGYKDGEEVKNGYDPLNSGASNVDLDNIEAEWKTYKNDEYGFEIKYPKDWSYTVLETPSNPIMFAPQNIIAEAKQSLQNIKGDKSLTLWFTVYDTIIYEKGIQPYKNIQNGFLESTSSDVNVGGIEGISYTYEYTKEKGVYKPGEKTISIDLPIDQGYLVINLFDPQYIDTFEKIISTLKFTK